ncbi:MAG: LacI family transcriptional regulator [Anaerolineae bacterium]|nr:LacI family transcriptional regulator [Anaerolineae bacterium]
MATIKDVARAAKVSTATVSHVLNGTRYVSEGLRERVLKAIAELDYRPSQVAASLRTKRSNSILLIIPDIANPFFPPLVRGVQDVFDRARYAIIVGNTDRRRSRELEFLNLALRAQADGVIIVASEIEEADLLPLAEQGIPAVLIGTHIDHPDLDVVRVDNRAAAYDAVRHLTGLGHRRTAMAFGPMSASSLHQRLQGYRQAMADAGLEVNADWIVEESSREAADYQGIRQLMARPDRPTAIFAAADVVALDVLVLLRELGLRVPEDVSVVGFDDIPATRLTTPPLTTIHQPKYQMGQRAADLLLRRMTQDEEAPRERAIMAHRLVVRGSTAPPPTP